MKSTRNNNISVFVTVLSACLLAVGTSAQICAQPAHTFDLSSASFEKNEGGKKVRQVAKRLIYQSASLVLRTESDSRISPPSWSVTENTRALGRKKTYLVVTRLPRAGLEDSQAEHVAKN